jgi:gliding motility-associated-like protein
MFHIPLMAYLCDKTTNARHNIPKVLNFWNVRLKKQILASFFFTLNLIPLFSQTEGWTTTCPSNTPSVSEVMVDACGNEFQSEYVILRTGNQPFDISKLALKVINPTNNAFVGDVAIGKGNLNAEALRLLTLAAGTVCPYGTVFRNVFDAPYNGVVPENAAILFFVNKDSTDVAYLSPNTLTDLCGSKVFVAFGDLHPQSRGASIFRNYPQNGSCGNGGCLREIQFQFDGKNAPFCTKLIYDIKKLPHLNTTNPPEGFNEGSYIRPNANGTILYGGGNLTGRGVCISSDSLKCVIPVQPNYGQGYWNVSVFEGSNNFTNFKGFYQAKGHHTPTETASAGSFEYNTARDGWKTYESPSEAHPTYGALRTYNGCNVTVDNFSLLAKRKGFPCGNYDIKLVKYDDFLRIQIDIDGNGAWDFDKTMPPPACATGCGTVVWSGALNSDSKIALYSYDTSKDFNTTLVFDKKNTSPAALQIQPTVLPTTNCTSATGSISLKISGGIAPYTYTWTGATAITNNTLIAKTLLSGVYKVVVKDATGCRDSLRILVPQTNNLVIDAGKDTAFCAGGTAILRGVSISSLNTLSYAWTNLAGEFISNQALTSATPSLSTHYVLKTSDAGGCFKTDTVFVKVNDAPYLTMSLSIKDSICKKDEAVFKIKGAGNYTWSTVPVLSDPALSPKTGDKISLFASFLTAPNYTIIAKGTDANGCINTIQSDIAVKTCKTCLKNDTIYMKGLTCNPLVVGQEKNVFKNTNGCDSVVFTQWHLTKADTVFVNRTSCNPLNIGQKSERFKNRNDCDSLIITNTTLIPPTLTFEVKALKPISCVGKNDGQIGVEILNGTKMPYSTRWGTNDTGFTLQNIRAGLYHVTVTDAEGCQKSDSLRLKNPDPLSMAATTLSPKCFEDKYGSIRINTLEGGKPPYSIFSNNYLNSLDSLPFLIQDLAVGKQTFSISDKYNCSLDTSFEIKAGRKLSVNVIKSLKLNSGDSIKLNPISDGILTSILWTPPNGLSCDTCLSIIAKPLLSTVYTLQVQDLEGCKATESIRFFIEKQQNIFAPNMFSPNGDGKNEVFTIFTDASVVHINTLKIFNRWGNLLFESFDFTSGDESKGWNGSFNNTLLPSDIYIFFVELEYQNGKKEVIKGDVMLMR